ncbi:hypothetical protein [Streptomyces sp. NPDC085479]|uniref:hypothetical protein n=1 Tax=Streptomyces sp. NPDC085479 TaxID=3365726 RepID=UPI0037D0B1A5
MARGGRGEGGDVVLAVHEGLGQADAGRRHAVVLGEDEVLGAVGVLLGLVLALDDGEGVEDAIDVVAVDPAAVEEEGVEFGGDDGAAVFNIG